jgi:hypothetical protein
MACDPGECPNCELPLMHTTEFRALSEADLKAEIERQRLMARERLKLPLV